MFAGETIRTGADTNCDLCGKEYEFKILKTCGWYIGTECCGMPYTRESEYYKSFDSIVNDFEDKTIEWRQL